MIVKYTGTADVQEFGAADFKKADIEQTKLSFQNGVPKEVEDEVGEALISKEGIFGDHSFEQVEEEDAEQEKAEAKGGQDETPRGDLTSVSDTGAVSTSAGTAGPSSAGTSTNRGGSAGRPS